MPSTDRILELANANQQRAWQVIEETNVIDFWQSAGAEINLVGSLKTGLLMKHRDIDFHIYSSPFTVSGSFEAIQKLAEHPGIKRIEYMNLLDTDEQCIEWHAWYEDGDGVLWQLDMIHMSKGSPYDGYMERVAQRISEVLTPEMKYTILRLKYNTPEDEKIMGIEYYQAVIRDKVTDYAGFTGWRKNNPVEGVLHWMP